MAMGNVRAHVFVSGRVQGVFFRQSTERQAQSRGVTGWVRNLADGRVEAVFEGEEEAVAVLVEYCRRGPSRARVDNVEVTYEDYSGEFSGFWAR
jgi:acylphosphatase